MGKWLKAAVTEKGERIRYELGVLKVALYSPFGRYLLVLRAQSVDHREGEVRIGRQNIPDPIP